MTDNDQIQEIAIIIEDGITHGDANYGMPTVSTVVTVAETIYSKGYRKVRHGTWKRGESNGNLYAMCTACSLRMNIHCYGYAYCSLCGAKMDGGDTNAEIH